MKSFCIFLSLLLISIQSASETDPALNFLGSWSDVTVNINIGSYCCIPTSINITRVEGTTLLAATYEFSEENKKCTAYWNEAKTGTMNIAKVANEEVYDNSPTKSEKPYFRFELSGNKRLNVHTPNQNLPLEHCDFTMATRIAPEAGSGFNSTYIKIIGILVVVLFPICIFRWHRKKKEEEITQNCSPVVKDATNDYSSMSVDPNDF